MSIFGPFSGFWACPAPPKNFFQKSGRVTFFLSWTSNFMQNFRKIWWAVLRILCHGRTDGQTDGQELFPRTLRGYCRGSKNKKKITEAFLRYFWPKNLLLGPFSVHFPDYVNRNNWVFGKKMKKITFEVKL